MTLDYFLSLLFAGGIGGLLAAVANALKLRRDAQRDDRKQKVDESSAIAANAKTIADAAGNVVKLQDDQSDDLRDRVAQLRTDLNTAREREQQDREREQQDRRDFQSRLTEAENRLARAERRAGESERQALEFRQDVIRLGEQLDLERKANAASISMLKHEHQSTINKLVLIIESLFKQLKAAGIEPDFDLDDLKAMYIVDRAMA